MLHVIVEINAVVDLAAALADVRQAHPVEETHAAAHIGGGFAAREVARGDGGSQVERRIWRGWHRRRRHDAWQRGKIERQLHRRRRRYRRRRAGRASSRHVIRAPPDYEAHVGGIANGSMSDRGRPPSL